MMTDFVAEIQVRKYKRKQPLGAAGVSIRFHPRKRVFFLESWRQERKTRRKKKARETERMRVPFIWSRHTPSDVVLVPLSTSQGWLDAYFVNIRNCEVKRNTKGHQQTKILMEWSCNQRRVEIFHFPIVFCCCCCFCYRSAAFICYPSSFHIGFLFSPDRDDENEDARQKRQKTVERKWPNNVDRKIEHETFSWDWPDVIESSIVVSAF